MKSWKDALMIGSILTFAWTDLLGAQIWTRDLPRKKHEHFVCKFRYNSIQSNN
jgi:hypothetical protein